MFERVCPIVTNRELADGMYAITVDAGIMAKAAKPGQFVHIKCGGDSFLRRPISVCDSQEGFLKMIFEVKGKGTAWLADQKSGTLDILGPLGYGFDVEGRNILLVGGGIGTPPLLYAAKKAYGMTTAILGFQSESRVILKEHFRQTVNKVIYTTDDGSFGEQGFVTAPLRRELEKGTYDAILACGPKPMLKAVAALAEEFGVACQVSLEERMACGVGACVVCVCAMQNGTMLRTCKDGPVFSAKDVNWDM